MIRFYSFIFLTCLIGGFQLSAQSVDSRTAVYQIDDSHFLFRLFSTTELSENEKLKLIQKKRPNFKSELKEAERAIQEEQATDAYIRQQMERNNKIAASYDYKVNEAINANDRNQRLLEELHRDEKYVTARELLKSFRGPVVELRTTYFELTLIESKSRLSFPRITRLWSSPATAYSVGADGSTQTTNQTEEQFVANAIPLGALETADAEKNLRSWVKNWNVISSGKYIPSMTSVSTLTSQLDGSRSFYEKFGLIDKAHSLEDQISKVNNASTLSDRRTMKEIFPDSIP
jgi:hypothetical protein